MIAVIVYVKFSNFLKVQAASFRRYACTFWGVLP